MTTALLRSALHLNGLRPLGHCEVQPDDALPNDHSILLIGPNEPAFWPIFTASPEYGDGAENPLDRWSVRVLTAIARDHAATAVFPSDGPPYWPFFTWATRCATLWASPIQFLVHQDTGLFVSFRGALVLPGPAPQLHAPRPCDTCPAPCLTACPADALKNGYDAQACKAHLATPQGTDCMSQGCLARRACPIGQGKRIPAQAAFHMAAFA